MKEINEQIIERYMPVSYTHLDVYKRQSKDTIPQVQKKENKKFIKN